MKLQVLIALGISAFVSENALAQQRFVAQPRVYGPMSVSTPMMVQRGAPQPLPGAYIGRNYGNIPSSIPPQIYYNGVSPSYGVNTYRNTLYGRPSSPAGALIQAGRILVQPSQACAMWIDARGNLRC